VANVLKLTPDKKAKFLEVLRAGSSIADACTTLVVAYSTLGNHRLKSLSFDEQIRVASARFAAILTGEEAEGMDG
jgi:hypothetical protein